MPKANNIVRAEDSRNNGQNNGQNIEQKNNERLRIPVWLRTGLPKIGDPNLGDPKLDAENSSKEINAFGKTTKLMGELGLHTVCKSAKCPNLCQCFSSGTATFLILGNICTRTCVFCNIEVGACQPLDPNEPQRIAEAAQKLNLKHTVITSVTRDDLPDGGASHFAQSISALKAVLPNASVEVLIPDFKGSQEALNIVIAAKPDIINHNVETPPRHYPFIRPQADYQQSLTLLKRVKDANMISKSGLMVGLGETDAEVEGVLADLAAIKCDIVTIGQYMQPSRQHPNVKRYVHPDVFERYKLIGQEMGITFVFSAPLVRSSYNAEHIYNSLKKG